MNKPRNIGRWGNKDYPQFGWNLLYMHDLGEIAAVCEMCCYKSIRYVHYMMHVDCDEVLKCGCVCAGWMQDDEGAAKEREVLLKSLTERRLKWNGLNWTFHEGGYKLKKQGYVIFVSPYNSRWRWHIFENDKCFKNNNYLLSSDKHFNYLEAARIDSFDGFIKVHYPDLKLKDPFRSYSERVSEAIFSLTRADDLIRENRMRELMPHFKGNSKDEKQIYGDILQHIRFAELSWSQCVDDSYKRRSLDICNKMGLPNYSRNLDLAENEFRKWING